MRIHRPNSTRKRKKAFEKPTVKVVEQRPDRYVKICGIKLDYDDDALIMPCHRSLDFEEWNPDESLTLIEKWALVAERYHRK